MPKKQKEPEFDSSGRRIWTAYYLGMTIKFSVLEGQKVVRPEPPILRMK